MDKVGRTSGWRNLPPKTKVARKFLKKCLVGEKMWENARNLEEIRERKRERWRREERGVRPNGLGTPPPPFL